MVGAIANARLVRVEQAGISFARNAGAAAAGGDYIAYLDDDAIPAPDWIERILAAIADPDPPPALIGGRILPHWEAPLPDWWPPDCAASCRSSSSKGSGEYRTAVAAARPGALWREHGRAGSLAAARSAASARERPDRKALLSDEEVQLAWRLQDAGYSVRYNSRIVVRHQIQATRLTPAWLLSRLYWQGVSTVLTRRPARPDRRGLA